MMDRRELNIMSTIIEPMQKRIREITDSIDAQKTELTAYERVLRIELARETASANGSTSPQAIEPELIVSLSATNGLVQADVSVTNKTAMVAEIVKSYGDAGATAKDVDTALTSRSIVRSKNMVYTALSYLLARKKLRRRDGRYYPIEAKAGKPTKHRISPEGLQRIKDATQKRWAVKRAAAKGVAV
jgi:hypothetical protein